jgi:UV DNA damage endonuclease
VNKRIGFCCKWLDDPSETANMKINARNRELNTGSTTVAWLNRQTHVVAEQKLYDLSIGNIETVRKLIERVSTLDPALKMMRIGSDILPVYTEASWRYFYQDTAFRQELAQRFAAVGDLARANNVRLSYHPGQFCVLASDRPDVVERSIEEFEYHVDMARWMGYGTSWHDHGFKINVHISGRQGPEGIVAALNRLTPEARNLITIENDENSWGLDASLELEKHLALVLDIHHHWVKTGEYISADDDRVKRVHDSWRGTRPILHYSVSREDLLTTHSSSTKPEMAVLLQEGYKKQKLRAHSDFYWNNAVNDWALSFWDNFDIQCESKSKNLASTKLYEYYCQTKI